jgi:hypothetical protein
MRYFAPPHPSPKESEQLGVKFPSFYLETQIKTKLQFQIE